LLIPTLFGIPHPGNGYFPLPIGIVGITKKASKIQISGVSYDSIPDNGFSHPFPHAGKRIV
jgi:hypothetical protein